MSQGHFISCAFHFCYYYISSTSDHQALDPGGWGSLIYWMLEDRRTMMGAWGRYMPYTDLFSEGHMKKPAAGADPRARMDPRV